MQKIIYTTIVCLFVISSEAQIANIRFDRISPEEGLSQNSITTIFQDSDGFMWFGTMDGLNRYDGYNIKLFRHNINNSVSIPDNFINVIYEDKQKRLWIGTRGNGLCRYDRQRETFKRLSISDTFSISSINCIIQDHKNQLWIATTNGLFLLSEKLKIIKIYKHIKGDYNSLSSNYINDIFQDKQKIIWIATKNGLDKLNPEKNIYEHFFPKTIISGKTPIPENFYQVSAVTQDNENNIWFGSNYGLYEIQFTEDGYIQKHYSKNDESPLKLSDNIITDLQIDNGILWIGTQKGGLNKLDTRSKKILYYRNNISDLSSISSDHITNIFIDKTKILWVGTHLGGLNKWDKANAGIELYRINPFSNNSLTSNKIRTIFEDSQGNIWIGTVDNGLNKWEIKENKYIQYKANKNTISDQHIRSITEDQNGIIWIGTDGGGIDAYEPQKNKFYNFRNDPGDNSSLGGNHVWKIFIDKKQRMWVGLYGAGLSIVENPNTNVMKFKHFRAEGKKGQLSSNLVTTIFQDSQDKIWIGTFGGGLNLFNEETSEFTVYKYSDKNKKSIGSNRIYTIMEDSDNKIWIGAKGSLNKFNRKDNTFDRYTGEDGLPNDVIMGIIEDDDNTLWISTNRGLSHFDKKNIYLNYDVKKGLQSNEFLVGSALKAKNGKIYFGGINGLNSFFPDSVKNNKTAPTIIISKLFINNKLQKAGKKSVLKRRIAETKKLVLEYEQRTFSFEFVALHYTQPQNNTYKYKLINFDDEWKKSNANHRLATYTNIPPGEYKFVVIAANSDGVWNKEGASVMIQVLPPIWRTWWFITTSTLIVIFGIFCLYKSRIRRIERQKIMLEKQVKERTKEVLEKQKEIMIQAEELEKLSIVARETDNAVMIMDKNGNFEWINEGFTRMFEYSYEQLISEVSKNIIGKATSEEIRELVNKCFNEKKTVSYELKTKTRSGKNFWVQTTLTPITNEKGEISKIVAIDSDINNIKKAEKEIKEINKQIKRQNDHIKGSIRYARTIQKAILPPKISITQLFDSFIIYTPKDIVSGDFYWLSVVPTDNKPLKNNFLEKNRGIPDNTKVFVAVADCTGHGVPGAFMSMIGSRLLSEIINEMRVLSPNEIMRTLDEKVKIALNQDRTDNNDGMDICLCMFEKTKTKKIKLTYCGAKRPLYIIQKGELQTIKGDRRTIGGIKTRRSEIPFCNNEIEIEKDTLLYLTSDGLTDQHAADRKRFGTKRMTDIMKQNINLSMQEQKEVLVNELYEYKKEEEQRDDITVVGLKII